MDKLKSLFSIYSIISFLVFFLTFISCEEPDQVAPGEDSCSGGASILTLDDSNISNEIKNRIFKPHNSSRIISVDHPNYNAQAKVVIIPIAFSESPVNDVVTRSLIEEDFFSTGTGSVKDYFLENSWGQFSLRNAGISNWVNMPQSQADYGADQRSNDFTRSSQLKKDACERSSIDWESLDINGDRNITGNEVLICFLLPTGYSGVNRGDYISVNTNTGVYNIENQFTFFACKRNDDPDKAIETISFNFSTIWHEMAHGFFLLPDRYGSSGVCGTGGPGVYDIMSDNCSRKHMTAYDKMKIGWFQPKILTTVQYREDQERKCLSFPAIETTPAAIVLYSELAPDEYWIIENKNISSSPRNFERDLPESGLAVWWSRMDSDELWLVDASNPSEVPTTYQNAGNDALFKYNTGQTASSLIYLFSESYSPLFVMRAISEPDNTMFVEI